MPGHDGGVWECAWRRSGTGPVRGVREPEGPLDAGGELAAEHEVVRHLALGRRRARAPATELGDAVNDISRHHGRGGSEEGPSSIRPRRVCASRSGAGAAGRPSDETLSVGVQTEATKLSPQLLTRRDDATSEGGVERAERDTPGRARGARDTTRVPEGARHDGPSGAPIPALVAALLSLGHPRAECSSALIPPFPC